MTKMRLTSSAFEQGAPIPKKYTCQGEEVNPPLRIENVPEEAQSLVLIVEDPDVPKGHHLAKEGVWDHWIVFNIPPTTASIEERAKPFGTVGKGTGGLLKYQGPCPPDREHRYFFRLYALNGLLDLSQGATKEEVLKAMEGMVLAQCELLGRYQKV